jgi:hypothetical protein
MWHLPVRGIVLTITNKCSHVKQKIGRKGGRKGGLIRWMNKVDE